MSEHPAVAFLLAAHQRAEALARAGTPDPWTVHPYDWTSSFDASIGHHFEADVVGGSREGGGVEYLADAEFIVANSPGTVLRRVAAERRILAEHQPTREAKWRGPTSLDPCDLPGCACNGVPEDSLGAWEIDGCRVCASGPWYDAVVEHWPCRTVLLLAEAWGWTEEQHDH